MRKRRRKKWHAQDGDGKTELRGKGKYEDIWGIKLDGVPARGIDVRGGLGMHVEKGVTSKYAITLTDHNKILSKGELDGWPVPRSGGDGCIDACCWLAQVQLSQRGLPSHKCIEVVVQGKA